jgi:hypothetical protein
MNCEYVLFSSSALLLCGVLIHSVIDCCLFCKCASAYIQIYRPSLKKICVWSGHNEFVAQYTVFFQEHCYQLLTKGCLTWRQMLNEQECSR